MAEYARHLRKQYEDRMIYWRSRADSKLPLHPSGEKSLTIICDGMDHSKFKWPRVGSIFGSKDFASLNRPVMDCYAAILHGHGVVLATSLPFLTRKDSSFCAEVLNHVLHLFSQWYDLREYCVIIQSDNTSREIKNNCLKRWGGLMVGLGRCRRMEFRYLISGHSHEDCDAWFANIAN